MYRRKEGGRIKDIGCRIKGGRNGGRKGRRRKRGGAKGMNAQA